MEDREHEVTRSLKEIRAGVAGAEEKLFSLCYEEICAWASRARKRQQVGHSWSTTDIAHEVFVKIRGSLGNFESRSHFFGAVGRAMRQALIDHARRPKPKPSLLAEIVKTVEADHGCRYETLHRALENLEKVHAQNHELVNLHFFGGLTMEETAKALGVSLRTAERDWHFVRSWLKRKVKAIEQ